MLWKDVDDKAGDFYKPILSAFMQELRNIADIDDAIPERLIHYLLGKNDLLKMPKQFYHIDFKKGSDNTVEVVCDEGWQISMRIHNASSRVEPSLKFDVQLISFPSSIYAQVEPWDSEQKRQGRRMATYIENIHSIDAMSGISVDLYADLW